MWIPSAQDLATEKAKAEVEESRELQDIQREKTLANLLALRKLEKALPQDEPEPDHAKPASRLHPDFFALYPE